jgi:hypothetical protein
MPKDGAIRSYSKKQIPKYVMIQRLNNDNKKINNYSALQEGNLILQYVHFIIQ